MLNAEEYLSVWVAGRGACACERGVNRCVWMFQRESERETERGGERARVKVNKCESEKNDEGAR